MSIPNTKVSEEFRLEFARRLQAARKLRGLRAIDVSTYMNMERSAYSNYERGYRIPNVENINKLEQFLQTPPGYLLCSNGRVHVLDNLADYLSKYKIIPVEKNEIEKMQLEIEKIEKEIKLKDKEIMLKKITVNEYNWNEENGELKKREKQLEIREKEIKQKEKELTEREIMLKKKELIEKTPDFKNYIDIVTSLQQIINAEHFVRGSIELSPTKVSKIKREISYLLKKEL